MYFVNKYRNLVVKVFWISVLVLLSIRGLFGYWSDLKSYIINKELSKVVEEKVETNNIETEKVEVVKPKVDKVQQIKKRLEKEKGLKITEEQINKILNENNK